jgi:hypothetical protein
VIAIIVYLDRFAPLMESQVMSAQLVFTAQSYQINSTHAPLVPTTLKLVNLSRLLVKSAPQVTIAITLVRLI